MTNPTTPSVYDILPDFDSYIADVEANLAMDADVWDAYQNNPVPAYTDVLADFGNCSDFAVILAAAKAHAGQS